MSEAGEFEDEDEIDKTKLQLQLPRVFIGGKYIGGAEEVKQLHETGKLKKFVERLPAVTGGVCVVCGDFRVDS
ncbi:putative Thioredoxin-like superfamily [Helianthus annuus]|nr:putative Thioredoxin-like superfamily [Helianthus annuus]